MIKPVIFSEDGYNQEASEAAVFEQNINAQTGTSYTLSSSDAAKFVTLSNAGSITLTVPPNSSDAIPVGTGIDVAQFGVGQVTVTPGSGVTVLSASGLKFRAQYSGATLRKVNTDTWIIFGDLTT